MSTERRGSLRRPLGWVEAPYYLSTSIQQARRRVDHYSQIPAERLNASVVDEENKAFGQRTIRFDIQPDEMRKVFRNNPNVRRIFHDLGVKSADPVETRLVYYDTLCAQIAFIPKEVTPERLGIILRGNATIIGPGRYGGIVETGDPGKLAQDVYKGRHILSVYNGSYAPSDSADYHPFMAQILTSANNWVADLLGARVKPE